MCLLIHKPCWAELPEHLLESAAGFNPHGYGFIGFGREGGSVVRRSAVTNLPELRQLYDAFRERFAAHQHDDFARIARKMHCRLTRGIRASHNEHNFVLA